MHGADGTHPGASQEERPVESITRHVNRDQQALSNASSWVGPSTPFPSAGRARRCWVTTTTPITTMKHTNSQRGPDGLFARSDGPKAKRIEVWLQPEALSLLEVG